MAVDPQPLGIVGGSRAGGIQAIKDDVLLRQKFKVPRNMTVSKVRLALVHWGPLNDFSNMRVRLLQANTSMPQARGTPLATANYTTGDSLYLGETYRSPWNEDIVINNLPASIIVLQRLFDVAVALDTATTYYLEFRRDSGVSTFGLQLGIDEFDAYPNETNGLQNVGACWEGWSSSNPSTVADCKAQWSASEGVSWTDCSIYDDTTKTYCEVRARLVI